MTPMEAWGIVAPILDREAKALPYTGELNEIDKAYVQVFIALQEREERSKWSSDEEK